ncbi:hypothetical protein LZ31DRAFT_206911 [Colletotrichum somersetense]|nr:hypothetical protein LZ31DRAFT_206911 [Colletotrichum somersetense]
MMDLTNNQHVVRVPERVYFLLLLFYAAFGKPPVRDPDDSVSKCPPSGLRASSISPPATSPLAGCRRLARRSSEGRRSPGLPGQQTISVPRGGGFRCVPSRAGLWGGQNSSSTKAYMVHLYSSLPRIFRYICSVVSILTVPLLFW